MENKVKNPALVVAVAAFAAFLATFNETFMNVGFTAIMQDLQVSVSTVQWLATAYMLGAAVMVPVSAFVYRKIPTKPLFLTVVGVLIAGSVIGALAQNFTVLLVGRVVQSFGTGLLIPIGMNITLEVAPREKLGSYMGIMGAMTTLGPSLSVIIAGVLLSIGSWHLLMWTFGGLCLLLFLLALAVLKNVAHLTNPRLDVASVILIGLSLVGILYGVSTIFQGNKIIALGGIVVGAVLMVLFVQRQSKLEEPLINLKPLTVKAFRVGVIINMLSLIIIFAMNIVTPMFVQAAGASAMTASLILFPAILLSCVVAPVAGKIYDKQGAKLLLPIGFVLIGLFAAGIALFKDYGNIVMAVLYVPIICGSALIIGPVQSFALSKLRPEENPHGVTVMSTGFQIAGCVGSSVFTGIYSLVLSQKAMTADALTASGDGFFAVGMAAAACAVIGLILSLKVKGYEAEKQEATAPAAASPVVSFRLADLMKTEVYSVKETATVAETLSLLVSKKISGVPVLDQNDKLVGFVSDGDILGYLGKIHPVYTSVYAIAASATSEEGMDEKLKNYMNMSISEVSRKNKRLVTVDINDDISTVCDTLFVNHLKKAPVMDNGNLVGVINRSNVTKFITRNYLLENN